MAPRPSTRHYPSRHWEDRGAERPPDPAEASRTPLVDPADKHPLNHQAEITDPDSDSDPYADAEDEGLAEDERD